MFTTIDKALVAFVGSALFLIEQFTGFSFGLDPEVYKSVIAAALPFLVWRWPNRPWA